MTRHNKKRNAGLIYEFLVRSASNAIVEGDDKACSTALGILRKRFAKGTELHKEFRLFHSLAATTVKSEQVADSILEAAKRAAKRYSPNNLRHEKNMLIKEINYNLKGKKVYNQRMGEDEYRMYATIQTLLDEWRKDIPSNIVKTAEYEQLLREWLLKDKDVPTVETYDDADPLVEKLMIKKLNERYKGKLTKEQIGLIKEYVFSGEDSKVKEKLNGLRSNVLGNIDSYLKSHNSKNSYLTEKLKKAKQIILETKVDKIDGKVVEKFLDIAKLSNEMEQGE